MPEQMKVLPMKGKRWQSGCRDSLIAVYLLVFCCGAWAMRDLVSAHAPESYMGVLITCFVSNAALAPSVSLLVILPFISVLPMGKVIFFAALGASLGEMTGYYLGFCGGGFLKHRILEKLQEQFLKYEMLWVFLFCILPIPVFDVIGVLAGSVKMNPLRFYAACFAGKYIKMFVVGWIANELVLMLF